MLLAVRDEPTVSHIDSRGDRKFNVVSRSDIPGIPNTNDIKKVLRDWRLRAGFSQQECVDRINQWSGGTLDLKKPWWGRREIPIAASRDSDQTIVPSVMDLAIMCRAVFNVSVMVLLKEAGFEEHAQTADDELRLAINRRFLNPVARETVQRAIEGAQSVEDALRARAERRQPQSELPPVDPAVASPDVPPKKPRATRAKAETTPPPPSRRRRN